MTSVSRAEGTAESAYLRRIRLTAARSEVVAEMEDDFHHFEVRLGHDGQRVTEIHSAAIRYPWSTLSLIHI